MTFPYFRVSLVLCSFFCSLSPVSAQSPTVDQITSKWFQEERFLMADRNDDARLDRTELAAFPEEFVYFLDPRQLSWADQNRDGVLHFSEMMDARQSELNFRFQQERRAYQELVRSYPLLPQADTRYLKDHPELVTMLFGNLIWMLENAELARSVYEDPVWAARHPESMMALHRNLRWMAANPAKAKDLYRDRQVTQSLPELLAWRADHQDLIRRHPGPSQLTQLDFIHAGIRIRR